MHIYRKHIRNTLIYSNLYISIFNVFYTYLYVCTCACMYLIFNGAELICKFGIIF